MKNIALIIIMIFAGQTTFAQEQKFDWKSMKPDQRKDIIQRMSPQERQSLQRQFRQNLVVSEIDVPESKEEEFKSPVSYTHLDVYKRQVFIPTKGLD